MAPLTDDFSSNGHAFAETESQSLTVPDNSSGNTLSDSPGFSISTKVDSTDPVPEDRAVNGRNSNSGAYNPLPPPDGNSSILSRFPQKERDSRIRNSLSEELTVSSAMDVQPSHKDFNIKQDLVGAERVVNGRDINPGAYKPFPPPEIHSQDVVKPVPMEPALSNERAIQLLQGEGPHGNNPSFPSDQGNSEKMDSGSITAIQTLSSHSLEVKRIGHEIIPVETKINESPITTGSDVKLKGSQPLGSCVDRSPIHLGKTIPDNVLWKQQFLEQKKARIKAGQTPSARRSSVVRRRYMVNKGRFKSFGIRRGFFSRSSNRCSINRHSKANKERFKLSSVWRIFFASDYNRCSFRRRYKADKRRFKFFKRRPFNGPFSQHSRQQSFSRLWIHRRTLVRHLFRMGFDHTSCFWIHGRKGEGNPLVIFSSCRECRDASQRQIRMIKY